MPEYLTLIKHLRQQFILLALLGYTSHLFAIETTNSIGVGSSYFSEPEPGKDGLPTIGTDSNSSLSDCFVPQETSLRLKQLEHRAKKSRASGSRWFRAEYDFDSRGFDVLHFMGNSPLPLGLNLWGFIDIEGADSVASDDGDLSRYFLELDLQKKIWKSGGVVGELNDLQGSGNAIGRFGFFHKFPSTQPKSRNGFLAGKGFVAMKVFPVETDGRGSQASLGWDKRLDNVFGGRFSAGGFVDVNLNAGSTGNETIVVSEHQVRYRVVEGFHLITEFRLNEFLQNDFGIAPGIQYRF